MKRRIRIIIICAAAAAVLLLSLPFAAASYLVHYALDTQSPFAMTFAPEEPTPENEAHRKSVEYAFEWLDRTAEDVYIENDGLRLHAYLGQQKKQNGARWVLAVHGYKASPADMAPFAQRYYQRGWNILVPDQRAHGLSEGRWIGMGALEKDDMLCWIRFILERDPDARIVLHGVSMGAATVMMVAGEQLPPNVRCIIEDCGYTSVSAQFSYQLNQLFHLPSFPLIPLASAITKKRAGWSFSEADMLAALKRTQIPVLCIHGSEDSFVPFSMLDEIYEAIPTDKVRLIVRGAEHARSRDVNPTEYWTAVDLFVNAYD